MINENRSGPQSSIDDASSITVALLIETSSSYGREILRGVLKYVRSHARRHWITLLDERDVNAGIPAWIGGRKIDGIISRVPIEELGGKLSDPAIPRVHLGDRLEKYSSTTVRSDDRKIGQLAADHLLERGIRHFGFCGFRNEAWSDRRSNGFWSRIQSQTDARVEQFDSDWYGENVITRDQLRIRLVEWLLRLPRPVGIMACNDVCGKQLIDCCMETGIRVPDDVAVVGVDDDELLCSFSRPPLSSVKPNPERIGFTAAGSLEQQLDAPPELGIGDTEILIPPLGVSVRQSTDSIAVDDPEIASALRFIREKACEGIGVEDVVSHSVVSRSTLERKLRNVLNRSPQQEIRRVQLETARRLLAESDMSIDAIALKCGFDHPEYLHVVFKREFRETPGQFRKRAQIG